MYILLSFTLLVVLGFKFYYYASSVIFPWHNFTDVLAKVIVTQNKAEINEDDADAYTHEKTCFEDEVCTFFLHLCIC